MYLLKYRPSTPAQPQKSTPLTTIEYKAQQEAKRASLVQEVEAKELQWQKVLNLQ